MKAQDPVAWMAPNGLVNPFKTEPFNQPLYPLPQKREWVGLTDDEIMDSWLEVMKNTISETNLPIPNFALAIENKLKEKNND